MCETFLIGEQEIELTGYRWFGNNRKQISKRACRGSGGVGILISLNLLKHFNIAVISDKFEGILWVQLVHKYNKYSLGICACYLPPAGSSRGDYSQEFFDSLKSLIIDNYHVDDFLICGDFNARCGALDDLGKPCDGIPSRIAIDATVNQFGRELISTLKSLDLCLLNGRSSPENDGFTSVSPHGTSVVDYNIVPTKSYRRTSNFNIHDPLSIVTQNNINIDSSLPDHRIISVEFDIEASLERENFEPASTKVKFMPSNYMQDETLVQKLETLTNLLRDRSLTTPVGNIDEIYNEFCSIIDSQLDCKTITPKGNVNHRKAWWNKDLSALAREVRLALKKWEANKSNKDLKLAYLEKQKCFSKMVRGCKRKLRKARNDKLIENLGSNPRKFWTFIKNIGGSDSRNLPDTVTDSDGNKTSEPSQVREEWKKYFEGLLNPLNSNNHKQSTDGNNPDIPNSYPSPYPNQDVDCDELNDEISMEEVEAAIHANNDHKSPGIDGIRPAFIKNSACTQFIHALCNHCLKNGTVPSAWLEAIIKPIPKANKNSTLPSEYRGIALQSFAAKTYCRILNNRLRDFLEVNNALNEEQNGFRPGRCCQDHIFTLAAIVENRLLAKKDTFACFIDFRKAFDCVDRKLLWRKLEERYKIQGNFLLALKALYSKVNCAVDVNNVLSDWFEVNSGVKQGCILSPTLFAMFIDDLVDNLNSVQGGIDCGGCLISSLLYADDIVVLAPDENKLGKLIKVVERWCGEWKMALNVQKTKIMHFRKKRGNKPRTTYVFEFNGDQIALSDQYKYLGITFSEHLEWGKTLTEICTKANRALALLNHRSRLCGGLHTNIYSLLFKQLVESIILCNACIWGHHECKNILAIQINALRFLLGVGKACPKAGLFGETGWVPLEMCIKFSILRFRKRIANLDHSRLVRKVYEWSKSLSGPNYNNWARKTTKLLESIHDFGGLMCGEEIWHELAKLELDSWKGTVDAIPAECESGGRFRFYRLIKPSPSPEQYITSNTSLNKRRFITQLRCGCLPLEVELGRYRSPKTPLRERLCALCNESTGDEVHFLTVCPSLNEPREKLTTAMTTICDYSSLDSMEKTIRILQACSSSQAVRNATFHMHIYRSNLLR